MSHMASHWINKRTHVNEKARRLGLPERVSGGDLQAVVALYGSECFYCLVALDYENPQEDLMGTATFDHLVPFAAGGRNTKRNIVPCCFACNQKKGSRRLVYRSSRVQMVYA